MKNKFLIFYLFIFFLFSCSVFNLTEIGLPEEKRWTENFTVFFTDPGTSSKNAKDTGIKEKVVNAIEKAKSSIDIAIYELSEPEIYNSLIKAHKKGVKVRFVGDIDNTYYEGYIALSNENIPMSLGNKDKIMHNKFLIIDNELVITGSANYTPTGFYNNNENIIFIRSSNVAFYYQKEFENMFLKKTFGKDKIAFEYFDSNVFWVGDIWLKVLFTPYYTTQKSDVVINSFISNAKKSIHFAIFSFTHVNMASNIIRMGKENGVEVKGVFDEGWHNNNVYSVHHWFLDSETIDNNIKVVLDGNSNILHGNPYHGGKVHDKFMVIDDEIVITGSLNFSKAASQDGNDENVVIISNKNIAQLYEEEFQKMYKIGYSPTREAGGDKASYHDVIISEIHWTGSKNNEGTIFYEDQFIELYNNSNKKINLSGWRICYTTKKSYRTHLYIIPKNTILEPGQFLIVGYNKSNSAFSSFTYFFNHNYLYLYHSSHKNYVYLELKDCYGNLIDKAGSFSEPPFAGERGSIYKSMERIGDDGTIATSWRTCTNANNYVNEGYRMKTYATPGTR